MPATSSAMASYVGSKGTHLLHESYVNVVNPVHRPASLPRLFADPLARHIGDSSYEALSISLKRTFSRGLLFSANYTWSHEIDDDSNGSGDGDSITAQNVSCRPRGAPQCGEYADRAFDARNVFNPNAIYELPLGPGKSYLNRQKPSRALFSRGRSALSSSPERLSREPHHQWYRSGWKHQRSAS